MFFDDIVGQKYVVRSLKNSLDSGRVAHAYMFCGPDGVGKSLAASIFASALNCRGEGLKPCGMCPSCLKAVDGNHPDIIHVKPEKLSISVENVRELSMDMQKKPYEKGVRVYIIHDAQKMTEQAQNALLKILEEPPSHVIIILLTFNRYSILNTIVSRCQVYNFSRASEDEIEKYLNTVHNISDRQAKTAAAFSGGIVKKALEFLNDSDLKKTRDEVIELTMKLYKKDTLNVLSFVDYFLANKDKIDIIIDIMISFFRDMYICRECGGSKYLMNLDRADDIARECILYTAGSLSKIIDTIKTALQNIKYNANYQLAVETMLLNIQEG